MHQHIKSVLALALILGLVSCATTPTAPTQKPPGFLPNYNLLQPMPSPEGTQVYMYKNPQAKRSSYNAGIVDPVYIYQGVSAESGVTTAQLEQAKANIDSGIRQIVSRRFPIVTTQGQGVFRLQVAITGATLEKDSFKPWNIIPVSLALNLASKATGLDNKKPVLVIEVKITDSVTGILLKEVATTIEGEKFRMADNTADEFSTLAKKWVEQAIQYAEKN